MKTMEQIYFFTPMNYIYPGFAWTSFVFFTPNLTMAIAVFAFVPRNNELCCGEPYAEHGLTAIPPPNYQEYPPAQEAYPTPRAYAPGQVYPYQGYPQTPSPGYPQEVYSPQGYSPHPNSPYAYPNYAYPVPQGYSGSGYSANGYQSFQ
ncbi:uncharacterized protein LOC142345577 [Convolutriloba macropyga]|uniref:uncharacterized protein LOC142345577 n=1 Tax=Convolutriloba macropyga TaxID=536237 RepID=UPI003F523926